MRAGTRRAVALRGVILIGAASALAATIGAPAAAAAPSLKTLPGTYPSPTFVAQPPGKPNLLFVTEQAGRIAVLRHGKPIGHDFLDMSSQLSAGGEQGLLSMAFDPGYRHNRRFYVYFTNHNCKSGACNVEVAELKRSRDSATRANLASEHKVIEVNHHQAGNHNGGQVAIGPDGYLYMAIGDGGTQEDPENDAQNTDVLLGKVLRIDPKPGGGYRVPPGNPFVGVPGRDPIFATGLRNPYRFSFDSRTGDFWVGDVGDFTWEEIDRATPAQLNGANFGWNVFEGPNPCGPCGFGEDTDPPPDYVAPVHFYPHSGTGEKGNVIIGGYVVHNRRLPTLNGKYVYTDNGAGDLRSFNPATGKEKGLGLSVSGPSSFGQTQNGSMYVTSLFDNKVLKLVDHSGAKRAHRGFHVRLAKFGNFDSPDYVTAAPGVHHVTYVVQRAGKIIAVRHGHRHTFLHVANRTTTDGERGLLSVAFDPHFERNHLLYTYSTNRQGNIEIDEFHAASPVNAREKSRRKVIEIPHPGESNHNGGTAVFGPDGKLYFGTGDGGAGGDPPENSQNRRKLLGKLIRINPHRSHGHPYTIPRSNPFVHRKGRDEIYALGLRNPFRFSFDNKTRHVVIGDVGQDTYEEVDYESGHSLRGANFGWDHFEGYSRFDYPGDNEAPKPKHHYEPPIHVYPHSGGGCAIIGGYVVRDRSLHRLKGRYVYDDLCTGQLRTLVPHRKRASGDRKLGLSVPDPGGFGTAHGHLYVASLDGPVYRLAPKHHH